MNSWFCCLFFQSSGSKGMCRPSTQPLFSIRCPAPDIFFQQHKTNHDIIPFLNLYSTFGRVNSAHTKEEWGRRSRIASSLLLEPEKRSHSRLRAPTCSQCSLRSPTPHLGSVSPFPLIYLQCVCHTNQVTCPVEPLTRSVVFSLR